jgi:type II secretory pathway component GspD/PulD (secretin)
MIFGSLRATHRVPALASVVMSIAVALLAPAAARAQVAPAIEWTGGRLSVKAEQVPLRDVLDAVARRTGVAFSGTGPLQDDVSFHFSGLTLDEALKQLAAGFNHVVVEERTPRGEIRPVLVLFLSEIDSRHERGGELATIPAATLGPPQTEAERGEVESVRRRIAARVLVDQADPDALPPGLSRNDLVLQLERGLARQAELDRAAGGRD